MLPQLPESLRYPQIEVAGSLLIRRFGEQELDVLYSIELNSELKRFVQGSLPSDTSSWRVAVKQSADQELQYFAVVRLSDGVIVGTCGLILSASCKSDGSQKIYAEIRVILKARDQTDSHERGLPVARELIKLAEQYHPNSTITATVHSKNGAAIDIVARLGDFRLADTCKIASCPEERWLVFHRSANSNSIDQED